MKELVIISGKGGTGKTSLTAAFTALAEKHVVCDADVDAADLHLLLQPDVQKTENFTGGGLAFIRESDCSECGKCVDLCAFDAISQDLVVDPVACEGCGVCVDLCPEQAIDFPTQTCGQWFLSDTRYCPMVHARLGIGEENSGKLVSLIRGQARELAERENLELVIIDGPPGIGCPVIASITGTTAILVIVEPTVSGVHDLKRVVSLANHFRIPVMICINKADLNLEVVEEIRMYAQNAQLELVGTLPFDPVFTRAMVAGKNVIEFGEKPELADQIRLLWEKVIDSMSMKAETVQIGLPLYKK